MRQLVSVLNNHANLGRVQEKRANEERSKGAQKQPEAKANGEKDEEDEEVDLEAILQRFGSRGTTNTGTGTSTRRTFHTTAHQGGTDASHLGGCAEANVYLHEPNMFWSSTSKAQNRRYCGVLAQNRAIQMDNTVTTNNKIRTHDRHTLLMNRASTIGTRPLASITAAAPISLRSTTNAQQLYTGVARQLLRRVRL